MNGVIVVNKEKDYTSNDVITKIKKILNIKKVGHAGTLDPLATGVLVVLVGDATKISNYLMEEEKTYVFDILLGKSSTTEDITGEILESKEIKDISLEDIDSVLASLNGPLEQVPPMYSAIKIKGKKLYELARKGIDIERKPRLVEIKKIKRISEVILNDLTASFKVEATVSKGTYIRTLCVEIGKRLGYPALMKTLTRTSSGSISINESYSLKDIENGKYHLKDMLSSLCKYKQIELSDDLVKQVQNGTKLLPSQLNCYEEVIVLKYQNELKGIYRLEDGVYKANRVWN